MKLQSEALGQQVLVHRLQVTQRVRGAIRLCLDVKALRVQPLRPTQNLAHGYLVHQADHQLYRDVLRHVSGPARKRLDSTVQRVRLRRMDRGDVKGKRWRRAIGCLPWRGAREAKSQHHRSQLLGHWRSSAADAKPWVRLKELESSRRANAESAAPPPTRHGAKLATPHRRAAARRSAAGSGHGGNRSTAHRSARAAG